VCCTISQIYPYLQKPWAISRHRHRNTVGLKEYLSISGSTALLKEYTHKSAILASSKETMPLEYAISTDGELDLRRTKLLHINPSIYCDVTKHPLFGLNTQTHGILLYWNALRFYAEKMRFQCLLVFCSYLATNFEI
jgi:hypothetical protein